MKTIEIAIDWICKVVCLIATAVMVLSIGAQVFCRYILNSPLSWPEEISMTAFCFVGFAGICMMAAQNKHLRMDILPALFPSTKKIFDFLAWSFNAGYLVFLAYLCWDMVEKTRFLEQELIAVPLPVWYIWAYMAIISLLAVAQTLISLIKLLQGKEA